MKFINKLISSIFILCFSCSFVVAQTTTLNAPSGHSDYKWYMDGVLIPLEVSDSYVVSTAGVYVASFEEAGCSKGSEIFVLADMCDPDFATGKMVTLNLNLPDGDETVTWSNAQTGTSITVEATLSPVQYTASVSADGGACLTQTVFTVLGTTASCPCPFASGMDTDGDGIDDTCDLDDDNDGILDTDELTCTTATIDFTPFDGQTDAVSIISNNSLTIGESELGLSYQVLNNAVQGDDEISMANGPGVGIQMGLALGSGNGVQDILKGTFTFTHPIENLTFTVHDLDSGDHIIVYVYDQNNNLITLQPSHWTLLGTTMVNVSGTNEFYNDDPTNITNTDGSVTFIFYW